MKILYFIKFSYLVFPISIFVLCHHFFKIILLDIDIFLLFCGHELFADQDSLVLFYSFGVGDFALEFALAFDEEILGVVFVAVGLLEEVALP